MRRYDNLIKNSIFVVAALLIGCIYSDSFEYGQDDYIVLYSVQAIGQDTGWSDEQMEGFRIPVWNALSLTEREQLGTVEAGSTVRVLRKSKYGHQIVTPDTSEIGWVNKIYVKKEFTVDTMVDQPSDYLIDVDPVSSTLNDEDSQVVKENSMVKFVEHHHEQDAG